MRSKLWIPLLLIIAVSIAALMAMGVKLARDERRVLFSQYRELYQARLKDYRVVIDNAVDRRITMLQGTLANVPRDPSSLRSLKHSNSLTAEVFYLDRGGTLRFPAPGPTATPEERQFLERTRSIWNERTLSERVRSGTSEGWHAYFWEDGRHLLYFTEQADGIIGVEVHIPRLYSHIITLLPDNSFFGSRFRDRKVVLLDEKGNTIYEWGTIEDGSQIDPIVVVNLLPPLDGLQFRYFVPRDLWDKPFYSSVFFTIIPAVLLVISILLMLAVYFYREHTRELREASQRVNFVNQVSHELKTPLTNIRMYAELLEQRLDEDDSKSAEHLSVIVSESQRLSRLIKSILTFSLNEKNKLELHKIRARIPTVIQEVLEQFRPGLSEHGIVIRTSFLDNSVVEVDTDFLQQILGNLITNVKKYAAEGKLLAIECNQKGDLSILKIYDRGPGIPLDLREKIFEAFYRSSNELTDGISGTGIGLSISRDLARLHGGDLRVIDSDIGACFLLLLKTSQPLGERSTDTEVG